MPSGSSIPSGSPEAADWSARWVVTMPPTNPAPSRTKAAKPADAGPAEAPAETAAPVASAEAAPAAAAKKPRAKKSDADAPADSEAHVQAPLKVEGAESEMTDSPVAAKRSRKAAKNDGE